MIYLRNNCTDEQGQGLVEYALILILAGLVVVIILGATGTSISSVYCQVIIGLNETPPVQCETDAVAITRADYNSGSNEVHIHATSDGGADPGVSLTAAPGGGMERRASHYHIKFVQAGCPCTITISSNRGGSATVTVG